MKQELKYKVGQKVNTYRGEGIITELSCFVDPIMPYRVLVNGKHEWVEEIDLEIISPVPSVDAQLIEWISVKDRLPKNTDEYNVVWDLNDGTGPVVTTMEYDAKEMTFTDTHGFCNSDCTKDITHWMPLPELPKQ